MGAMMLRNTLILSISAAVVVACADHPHELNSLTPPCHAATADSSEQLPVASPGKLPPSNVLKMGYAYPEELRRQHLEGRALVRLKVTEAGKVDSAEFVRVEAPPQVESAMCRLVQKVQFDVSKPGFESVDSRTLLLGIRYCLGNCSRVPVYPGFEKNEIAITGSP